LPHGLWSLKSSHIVWAAQQTAPKSKTSWKSKKPAARGAGQQAAQPAPKRCVGSRKPLPASSVVRVTEGGLRGPETWRYIDAVRSEEAPPPTRQIFRKACVDGRTASSCGGRRSRRRAPTARLCEEHAASSEMRVKWLGVFRKRVAGRSADRVCGSLRHGGFHCSSVQRAPASISG